MFIFSKRKTSSIISRTQPSPLDLLPDELLIKIFRYLKDGDFDRASRVCKRWQRVSRSPQLIVQRLRFNISAGFGHCLLQTHAGACFSWGSNHRGQLGYITNAPFSARPRRISCLRKKPLAFVSAGEISVGITRGGECLTWGSRPNEHAPVRDQLFNLFPVGRSFKSISAGWGHSLAITQTGECYAWGVNDFGQLGLSNTKPAFVPQRLKVFKKKVVTMVSAGSKHSLAVTQDGKCYAWGKNKRGELGLATYQLSVLTPNHIVFFNSGQSPSRVVCISAGGFHSMAVTQAGECYTWGSNRYGQLGIGSTLNAFLPQKVVVGVPSESVNNDSTADSSSGSESSVGLQNIGSNGEPLFFVKAAAGKCYSLALTRSGEVFSWGSNRYGQLGLGTTLNSPLPSVIGFFRERFVMDISAGGGHSLCLTTDCKCFSWGYNGEGQLGLGHTRNAVVPQLVPITLRDDGLDPEDNDVVGKEAGSKEDEGVGSFLGVVRERKYVKNRDKKAIKITKL
eukprot:TRINITY_DN2394_c0_g1_i1.p1 TRINITY_DN2394_c0_g1~~TRINITY_DN2394_c0_g1_i1.p1  ORF type:complete len:508 (-),score=70.63 TRINITY_DN2394_c0_g1_i1:164-1687(-)